MADFKALPDQSQCGFDDVFYFDAAAEPTTLYECATYRLDIARNMLEALSTMKAMGDERALPAVASAAALLMSDANGLLGQLYNVIRDHEQLVKACAAIEAETLTQ